MKINIGFLLAYDYELLKNAIPPVYGKADKIVLALDYQKRTWANNTFTIDPSFFEWIKSYDVDNKIEIYEDDFFMDSLNPMENETRERNMLAQKMGDGICLQIDADEYFVDFEGFVSYLKKNKNKLLGRKKIQICPFWLSIYKKLDAGILVTPELSPFHLGTNFPDYVRGRKNFKQEKWYVPFICIHQTLGRTEEELKFKLNNWGHKNDFDVINYFERWKSINSSNYAEFKNLHPLNDKYWKYLEFFEGTDLNEIIENIKTIKKPSKMFMFFKNISQRFKYPFSFIAK